jgi:hypothetical protein
MNSGGIAYVESGGKEPIEVQVFNKFTGDPLTGKTDIKVRIRRHADDYYYDWIDDTFKDFVSVGVIATPLAEIHATRSPGLYRLNNANHAYGFDTSKITNPGTDDIYEVTILQDGDEDAAGLPVGFELKVGNFLDRLLRIVALQKEHYFIDQTNYNTEGLLLSGRIRLFRNKNDVNNASDGGSGEGEFATYTLTTTPKGGAPERADLVRSVRDS